MDKEYARYLLEKTKEDYNLIAEDFSRTRSFVSPEFQKWLSKYLSSGEKALDLGCGNGKFYEVFNGNGVGYSGVDFSGELIKIAKNNHPSGNFLVASAFNLPFPDNFFDKVFCFAVFHHVPSVNLRLEFLKEIKRVLKPKGTLILAVWDLNPFKMIITARWKRLLNFLSSFGNSKLDFKDFFIPWQNSCQRYVHYFNSSELKRLVGKSNFKIKEVGILGSFKKESNLCLVAEKTNAPIA
ncbi:MAG: class I SAM-dependent methyltransferase [Candidatus Paceibacterota bacterium]